MSPDPAALLRERAREHRDQDGPGKDFPDALSRGFNNGLHGAADYLRTVEQREEVRFLALPVDALERLRVVWEGGDDDLLALSATSLLRDLFDGQDGYLGRIDAVLGPRR